MVRKKLVPRNLALTSNARHNARPAWTGTTTTAKYKVLRSEAQNRLSPNRFVKLSRPTNRAGRGEISRALVNASPNDSATGNTKKTTIRSRAGLTMAPPTIASLLRPVLRRPGGGATGGWARDAPCETETDMGDLRGCGYEA